MNSRISNAGQTCRVVAPSSREALRLVREKLGPDAVVLSNRVTAEGVEVLAALEEFAAAPAPASAPAVAAVPAAPVAPAASMSPPAGSDAVLREIHSMRGMIEEQLAGMAWNEKQRRDPVRGHLLRTLLGAGFSARLAKDILQDLPTGQGQAQGMDYAKAELARRMPLLEDEGALLDEGGVYALMGPTGVGKTTTTAKLAARCVMRFGADRLALVTTDSYRIGAYEQLRIYGQILGVSVHAVKDAADLDRVLAVLRDKHMVLIDTVGMSQRDRAVAGQIAMLCGASRPVKRLLLLNASSHGDTLNEVVQAYRHGEKVGGDWDLAGCIFTKVDEATHPGALIDMAIRHQLPVHYISSGQKVPEHLAPADGRALVDSVFQARSRSALFVPGESGLEDKPAARDEEAQATSERLRAQCRQLINALTHNAQELAANAAALSRGGIGFEETRALWRRLADPADVDDAQGISRALLSRAVEDSAALCDGRVLAVAGEARGSGAAQGLVGTLLLSDRTGKVFAAPLQGPADPAQPAQAAGWALQPALGKTVVHLFAQVPEAGLVRQWQREGRAWAAAGSSAMRVVDPDTGARGTLGKLAAGLDFGAAQPVLYRTKAALMSVAEARVSLRPELDEMAPGTQPPLPVLRCVVRRMVDAASGKLLAHSYVLAGENVRATARQMAQWPAWRSAAEPYFRLLGQGMAQLDAAAVPSRRLIAGQACATVFLLQGLQDGWAGTARAALAQLAGRALKAGRPVPAAVLLEGLGKLLVLLDALETEGVEQPVPAHTPAARD
ncbi:flagellar biosynthetic protein FlhF [Polaromonas sp. CF318]|uniref:flagellar biosynthesis protein FlhF n=1 Tax=Polaromonas sp. CF318 TaxID=1144318 RepID=UPI00027126F1|nr:flagellar biosynthesis protein FlhF [Polaromonas sp. CF318]EJL80320.1 flagellar biosynthetic protein FlhF [Polaromonas sp. CF318]